MGICGFNILLGLLAVVLWVQRHGLTSGMPRLLLRPGLGLTCCSMATQLGIDKAVLEQPEPWYSRLWWWIVVIVILVFRLSSGPPQQDERD